MYRTLILALALTAGLAPSAPPAPESQQQVADAVIAAERAALDKWAKGDPEGFLSLYTDDVSYFDPFQERRVDGRAALRTLYAPLAGTFSIHRYEIMNPAVVSSGDIAVLSYNLRNFARQPDGTEVVLNRWNSTTVMRRIGGRWRTIHSHWSFTKPELKTP